jgi:hypothetical protein
LGSFLEMLSGRSRDGEQDRIEAIRMSEVHEPAFAAASVDCSGTARQAAWFMRR